MNVTKQVANGSNCCNMNVDLLQNLQATIDFFGLKILYISSKMGCTNESTKGKV
jgi:predicted membrane GTPase involved in stress response